MKLITGIDAWPTGEGHGTVTLRRDGVDVFSWRVLRTPYVDDGYRPALPRPDDRQGYRFGPWQVLEGESGIELVCIDCDAVLIVEEVPDPRPLTPGEFSDLVSGVTARHEAAE